jgi:hypothetical protein
MTHPLTEPTTSPPVREVRYRCSEQFLPILRHLNASLLVSTYQAGKVAVVAANGDGLAISFANFDQPMGLAVTPSRLAVGARRRRLAIYGLASTARCASRCRWSTCSISENL